MRPSGENLSDRQVPGRGSSVATSCCVAMFHSFTLRSKLPVASVLPSGEKAMASGASARVSSRSPVRASHSASPTAWFEPEGFVTQNGAVQTVAPGKGQGVHLTLVPGSGRLDDQGVSFHRQPLSLDRDQRSWRIKQRP